MPNNRADRIRRWYDYERDAHSKVLQSLETVAQEGRQSAEFRRALSIFGHILSARRIWLGRLGVAGPTVASIFPEVATIADLVAMRDETEGAWTDYLSRLDDAALDRVVEYKSLDSGRFRNTAEDILTQLFGHSSYHRGQIAMLVNAAGGRAAITDFIYWCREPM